MGEAARQEDPTQAAVIAGERRIMSKRRIDPDLFLFFIVETLLDILGSGSV